MNGKKKIILLSILVLLGIGFAALTATLNINGTVSINGNASDFKVIYDTTYYDGKAKSKVNGLEYTVDDPTFTGNTVLNFNPSNGLISTGDYYEVSYKLLNNSTLYDALVNIVCGTNSDGTGDLTPFEVSGDITDLSVAAQGSYEGTIRFTYKTQVSENKDLSFTCKLTASAVSRTSVAESSGASGGSSGGTSSGTTLTTNELAIYNIVKKASGVSTTTSIDKVTGYGIDTVYYYNGNYSDLNNNIIFNNMCWKIVRTTETGGTKLMYNGVATDGKCETQTGEDTQIGTSAFNENYDDNAYVGYMHGATGASTYDATHTNTNPSTIKGVIDAWYKTNFVDSNSNQAAKLEDTVFCNDRSLNTGYFTETAGYGIVETHYGSYSRSSYYASSPNPTLQCTNTNDKFTLKTNGNSALNGNNALIYPVGLITLDEVRFAGLTKSNNSSNYLYTGQNYWTFSPVYFLDSARVGIVGSGGRIGSGRIDVTLGVRPVVSLANGALVASTGDGSTTKPYVVQ